MSGSISAGTRVLGALGLALMSTGAFAVPDHWTDWTGSDLDPGPGFRRAGVDDNPNLHDRRDLYERPGRRLLPGHWRDRLLHQPRCRHLADESTLVDNRPTGTDIIALQYAGSQTLSFTEAIANPVFAFVSLNFNGYGFDHFEY